MQDEDEGQQDASEAPAAAESRAPVELPGQGNYGVAYGWHPMALALFAVIGVVLKETGETFVSAPGGLARVRDVAVIAPDPERDDPMDFPIDVLVLVRIGGPHRERFRATWDAIRQHPAYRTDRDLRAEPTYAEIVFDGRRFDGAGRRVIEEAWEDFPASFSSFEDRIVAIEKA